MDKDEFLSRLAGLVEYTDELYNDVSCKWLKHLGDSGVSAINLKAKKVSDIMNDSRIREAVMEYRAYLNDIDLNNLFRHDSAPDFVICYRIKMQNSIEDKILRYSSEELHQNGKVPINKCLNDLFGVRVVADVTISHDDIQSFINSKYGHLRCIDSSKDVQDPINHPNIQYIATHIYYKGRNDNRLFPWELQIWSKGNRSMNDESHRLYKQDYIEWESDQTVSEG